LFNILLFGEPKLVQNLANYLGNTNRTQSAMLYFEFPNPKFHFPEYLEAFPEKLRMFVVQQSFVQSVLAPKRESAEADLMIWVFDWNSPESIQNTFIYLKKIILTRKSFLPLILVGYRSEISPAVDPTLRFLNLLRLPKFFEQMTQLPAYYLEITEKENEDLLLTRLRTILKEIREKFGEFHAIKKYSTIGLEELFKAMDSYFIQMAEETDTDLLTYLSEIVLVEQKFARPISRRFLQTYFGCLPPVSKKVIDLWEERVSLLGVSEDKMALLEKQAKDMFHACNDLDQRLSYGSLIGMGFDAAEIRYVFRYMFEKQMIPGIAVHLESEEYSEYQNIRDVIVIYEGRTLFVKTTNQNADHTQLFSGMIQAIEMIRTEYISKVEGYTPSQKDRVEGLEFGDLHAYLGHGNKNVELILRLNHRPYRESTFRKRVKNFLMMYEAEVKLEPTTDINEVRKIKDQSERLFYQNFNPFPISFNVFKPLTIGVIQDFEGKTVIEQMIIQTLQNHPSLLLEDLVEKVHENFHGLVARSDLVLPIFDLIEDRLIRFAENEN
jgi:hypothetical protein